MVQTARTDGESATPSAESMAIPPHEQVPQASNIRSRTSSPTITRSQPPTRRPTRLLHPERVESEDIVLQNTSTPPAYLDLQDNTPDETRADEIPVWLQLITEQDDGSGGELSEEPIDMASGEDEVEIKSAFVQLVIYCIGFLLVILWQAEQSDLYEPGDVMMRKVYLICAVFIAASGSQTKMPTALAAITLAFVIFVAVVASADAFDYFSGGVQYLPMIISILCVSAVLSAIIRHNAIIAKRPAESSKLNTASMTFLIKSIVKWSPLSNPDSADEYILKVGEALLYGSFIVGLFILWLRAVGLRANGGHVVRQTTNRFTPLIRDLLESVINLLVGQPPPPPSAGDVVHRGTLVLTFLEILGALCMVSGVVTWIVAFNVPHPVQAGSMSILIFCIIGVVVITCAPMSAGRRQSMPHA